MGDWLGLFGGTTAQDNAEMQAHYQGPYNASAAAQQQANSQTAYSQMQGLANANSATSSHWSVLGQIYGAHIDYVPAICLELNISYWDYVLFNPLSVGYTPYPDVTNNEWIAGVIVPFGNDGPRLVNKATGERVMLYSHKSADKSMVKIAPNLTEDQINCLKRILA